MSYATANENTQSQLDVSEEFLKRVSEHLNKSIDTQECTLSARRRANIEEANRIFNGLPQRSDRRLSYASTQQSLILTDVTIDNYVIIMKYGLYKMHDIIKNDFSTGWGEMNLYECTSGSFELFTILRDSTNEIHLESWRAALRLRLEEKLVCSKKAAADLERLHESYINLRPLTNYTATPNGSYDALYRTAELFRQTTEINQTYTRLTEHTKNYIESINGLLRIWKADDHEVNISYIYTNCTNGFWQASADYDRDLKLYESLVIRQPLQRISNSIRYFENYKASVYPSGWHGYLNYYQKYHRSSFIIYFQFRLIKRKLTPYINNLMKGISASKLSYARMLTSDKSTKLFDDYNTKIIPKSHALISKAAFNSEELSSVLCNMIIDASKDPLLKAFFAKLYDRYNTTAPSDRIVMSDYFKLRRNTLDMKLVRGDIVSGWKACVTDLDIPLKQLRNTILGNLTSFKDMMNNVESFLQTTRLDGRFFR